MKRLAFTLSELLISLVIIGVIAILTLPRVTSGMNKKTQVAALQSTYTALNSAVKMLMVDERAAVLSKTFFYKGSDTDTITDTAGAFMKKYLKIQKDCETEMGECFASSYKTLNKTAIGEKVLPKKDEAYCAKISTGASLCITPPNESNTAEVFIDINGPVKPNIVGRDFFVLYIYSDGFVGDRGSLGDTSTACKSSSYGTSCFNRIINSGWVMDY